MQYNITISFTTVSGVFQYKDIMQTYSLIPSILSGTIEWQYMFSAALCISALFMTAWLPEPSEPSLNTAQNRLYSGSSSGSRKLMTSKIEASVLRTNSRYETETPEYGIMQHHFQEVYFSMNSNKFRQKISVVSCM